ncbi:MAG TPA: hypothetical protein PK723_02900 [Candidatus Pacearchaeota archaeon]|nr:hypothetical protein [Candidatus Pacearchaeota archaeon]HQD89244.1 hypothetical protein [Candidatus Pacearchaeota archaeon]
MPQALYTYTISKTSLSGKRKDVAKNIKTSRGSRINLSMVLSIIFLLLFIACFGLYIYFTIQMVSINFDLRAKENKLLVLQDENKILETEIKEGLSLEAMEEKVQSLELVRAGDIRYLQFSTSSSLSQASPKEKR